MSDVLVATCSDACDVNLRIKHSSRLKQSTEGEDSDDKAR